MSSSSSLSSLSLSGLTESIVDDDDDEATDDVFAVLELASRTDADLQRILSFVTQIGALRHFNHHTRLKLCHKMVLATIVGRDTHVLKHGELIDAYCIVASGNLRHVIEDETRVLSVGDEFGESSVFSGDIYSIDDTCHVLCIPWQEYCELTRPQSVREERDTCTGRLVCARDANGAIVRASQQKLLSSLLTDDDTFIDTFLITYPLIISDVSLLTDFLLTHLDTARDRVLRVVLAWTNHGTVPEPFIDALQTRLTDSHLKLLHVAVSARARHRTVIITRSDRSAPLPFDMSVTGGGVFVTRITDTTLPLRVYDQIVELNGARFQFMTLARAHQLMTSSTHLQLQVVYNPHAALNGTVQTVPPPLPEHVIRVFTNSGECRYLSVHADTTAREATMVAVASFSLATNGRSSRDFALYEVCLMNDSAVRVRRIPDTLTRVEASLHARLYLRLISDTFDDAAIVNELRRESALHAHNNICTMDAQRIALALFNRNLQLFRSIDAHALISDDTSDATFGDASNREMFWTAEQLLRAHNKPKTAKQLLRIACASRRLRNYNTLFAIVAGLTHAAVTRLKFWTRMKQKYQKRLESLGLLMDPSRNMFNYRKEIQSADRPLIPFFPLIRKDFTFIHYANSTRADDDCVNFEKMRLLAREVRHVLHFADGQTPAQQQHNERTSKQRWEQIQMDKRIESFLTESLRSVSLNEQLLHALSNEAEPSQQQPQPQRNSHPSPTLSSASSSSSSTQHKRFGTESESDFRKLMSLSSVEQSINRNNRSHSALSLPIESSSVTSLRRLEQINQLRRFHLRPPSYDQTLELLKTRATHEHRV